MQEKKRNPPCSSSNSYVLCLYTTHMVSTERCLVPGGAFLCATALICTLVTFQNNAATQAQQIATQHEMNRELLAKQHEMNRELGAANARLNLLESGDTGASLKNLRQLQQSSSKDGACVSPDDVAVAALDAAFAVSEAFKAFEGGTPSKGLLPKLAVAQDKLEVAQKEFDVALKDKATIGDITDALKRVDKGGTGSGGVAAFESRACRRAVCADDPIDGSMCVRWGKEEAVDCRNSTSSTTQGFPAARSNPPCCREEWPLNASTIQTSTKSPQVFSNDTLFVKIDGTVKFTYLGFENVEQVDNLKDMNAVSGGIRSGNPTNGGSFSYTFAKAGVYYFRSQVHETLKATVNVMDCQYCTGTPCIDSLCPIRLPPFAYLHVCTTRRIAPAFFPPPSSPLRLLTPVDNAALMTG